jgi:hypothetical protein
LFVVLLLSSSAAGPDAESEALLSTLSAPARASYKALFGVSSISELNRVDIAVDIDPRWNGIRGTVKLSIRNASHTTLSEFVLRLWPNSAGAGRVMTISEVRTKSGPKKFEWKSDSVVSVSLEKKAPPGDFMYIEADFSAAVPELGEEQTNLYAQAIEQMFKMLSGGGGKPASTDYGVFASGHGIMNLGGFYPAPAYLGTGGWETDESNGMGDFSYGPPSNYFVSITTPPGYKAATPGRVFKSVDTDDGRLRQYVIACGVRDFVIELSSKFATKTDSYDGVTITAYHLPADAKAGARVLRVAKDAFTFYSKKFGAYPYAELKVVEAPLTGGAGGVEFPGLVTIAGMFMHEERETGAGDFFAVKLPGDLRDDMLDFIVSHEVAHQWWNAMVGSNPRVHPWVDEALASYSSVLYFGEVYGVARGKRMMETQVKLNYQMMRLFGGQDRPVGNPASSYNSMLDYAGIVYGKAPMFHHAIREAIGVKAYGDLCKEYARRFAFKTASPSSFVSTAGALYPNFRQKIEALEKRWIKETHGDEDIGQPDLMALVQLVTGQAVDGSVKEFMEELFPMMKQYR